MLAKDEADIIGTNLRHHMALGLSGMVVFDNMSRDGTEDIARSMPGVIVVPDPEPAFHVAACPSTGRERLQEHSGKTCRPNRAFPTM